MKWILKSAAVAAMLVSATVPAAAQDSKRERGGQRDFVSVEAALRLREELKLSSSQVSQLEALRKEIVAQRKKESSERIDLQSRIAAGLVERDKMRDQMESSREDMRKALEKRKEQLDHILTDEQRDQLKRSHRERAGQMRAPQVKGIR